MKVGIGEDGFWVLVLSLRQKEEEVEVVGFRAHQPTSPAAIKIIDADRLLSHQPLDCFTHSTSFENCIYPQILIILV